MLLVACFSLACCFYCANLAVLRSALDLAVAATAAKMGEAAWRRTRSSTIDCDPDRAVEEDLVAR